MKKLIIISVFIITLLFLLSFQCRKKSETTTTETTTTEELINKKTVDMDSMKTLIESSTELTTQVFVAITVYHKYYTTLFEDQIKNLSDAEKSKFFENKKNDFFKSIKYSEKEYNEYLKKNNTEINDYIISHPEITEYLTSIN